MQTQQNNKKENNTEKTLKADFDYAPSLESTDIVKINPKNKLFIGGKFVDAASGKYFKTDVKQKL